MFILDSLLVGGLRFVLDQVSTIADQEMNDPDRQRERLMEAQIRLEQGEIDEAEFANIESDVFERIRALKARNEEQGTVVDADHRIAGVDISVNDDDGS